MPNRIAAPLSAAGCGMLAVRQPGRPEFVHYQQHGYAVLRRFLEPQDTLWLRRALDRAVDNRINRLPTGGADFPYSLQSDSVFIQRVNLWQSDYAISRATLSPALSETAGMFANVHQLRLWRDEALVKRPGAKATPFHRDCDEWPFEDANALTVWIALDAADERSGCLLYSETGAHDGNTVPVIVEAGDACVHNASIVHGASPNQGIDNRRALIVSYISSEATYDGRYGVLPLAILRRIRRGDSLNDDLQTPVVYTRTGH